jgi:hypothetical protein
MKSSIKELRNECRQAIIECQSQEIQVLPREVLEFFCYRLMSLSIMLLDDLEQTEKKLRYEQN